MKMFRMFKKGACVLLMITPLFLASCSKDSTSDPTPNNPGSNNGFTAADFQLTIDKITEPDDNYPGVDYIRVDYTVKNLSNKPYPPRGLSVRWRVKAADGAFYERFEEAIVTFNPLNAGASVQSAAAIELGTPHNNADKSTLTYTLTP